MSDLKAQTQAEIQDAYSHFAEGKISEAQWFEKVPAALARLYLSYEDPIRQSGFDGDYPLWREARELVVDAFDHDGRFLDVGCANGYLMESIHGWALDRSLFVEPFGLEISPALFKAAQRRYPKWKYQIFEGNVMTWLPTQKFDFIRTGLEYVPPGRETDLIQHIMKTLVNTGGRLILGPFRVTEEEATAQVIHRAGFEMAGFSSKKDRLGNERKVLWINSPAS
ncbi:MAG: class I SAM-dependent methyltransferase [Verrucomicrobiae bacterium]|nr:class I SAM-dependent methyltransferase [Verrucomicrobiae bacterium]